jgi:sulfur carrier protein ThiS
MKVTVHLLPTRKETRIVNLPDDATVEMLVRSLGLLPDSWIALKGKTPLPTDDVLCDGDEVRLYSVVSGG